MKGFKKDGKFRPTGNKTKSSLKKNDVQRKTLLRNKKTMSIKEKENDDLVTGIIRAENGEMDDEEFREFVLKHKDTLMQLQGSWQRSVQSVLEAEGIEEDDEDNDDHEKTKYGELTSEQKTLVEKYVQKHPEVVSFEDFEYDDFEEIENLNPSEFIHSAVEEYIEELEGHDDDDLEIFPSPDFKVPRGDLSKMNHGRDAHGRIWDICGCKSCRESGEMKRREEGKSS